MKFSLAEDRVLICHPQTPSRWARSVQARLSKADGGLAITYTIEGELSRLCLPAQCAPGRVDGLWQHTCFEAFISVKAARVYHELNFSPSGQWAAYAFESYRDGAPLSLDPPPKIKSRILGNRLELDTLIDRSCLPPTTAETGFLFGLSAVIEEDDGVLSYWALRHPSARPDFHHPDSFILELSRNHVDATTDAAYTSKR